MIRLSKKSYAIIAVITVLYIFLALSSAYNNPVFADEPDHLSGGYTKVVLGDYRLNTEAPPIMQMTPAVPVSFLKLDTFQNSTYWQTKKMSAYSCQFLFENNYSAKTILFFGRLPGIILGLLLGLIILYFVAINYDINTALITYLLYATHPMIIANSSVIYIDFGFMFFNFLTFMFLLQFIKTKKEGYLYLFFLFFSITFLTKFTSLHNFVFYPLILALNYKEVLPWVMKNKKRVILHLINFILIFYLVILITYGFQDIFVPIKKAFENDPFLDITKEPYSRVMNSFETNPIMKFIGNVPNPFPYAMTKGIGNWVFDSRAQERVQKFENIKSLFLKNTIPILILFGLYFFRNKKKDKNSFYNTNFLYYIAFYLIIFNALGSFTHPRHILMIYPFIILISASSIKGILDSKLSKNNKIAILAILIVWHLASILNFYPEIYKFNSALRYILGDSVEGLMPTECLR